MQFTVERDALLRELALLQGVVDRKNQIPVLTHVLIEAHKGGFVHLVATDLDVALRCRIAARVQKTGGFTLPAKRLHEAVRVMTEDDIRIQQNDGDTVSLHHGRGCLKLAGFCKEDFPSIAEPPPGDWTPLEAAALRELIRKTSFAVCDEAEHHSPTSARFELTARRVRMVATDGHRLACMSLKRTNGRDSRKAVHVNVPKKVLLGLSKILKDEEQAVEFVEEKGHLFFRAGERLFISRYDGDQFPNYGKVIPKDNDKTVILEREAFAEALRRVSVVADKRLRAAVLGIKPGRVDVSSNGSDLGEVRESIHAVYEGEDCRICFNWKFLLDFLKATDSPKVCFALKDASSQALLQPGGAGRRRGLPLCRHAYEGLSRQANA